MAAVLFAVAAWLMLRGEPEQKVERRADKVTIPRYARSEDFERMEARRTWMAPVLDGGAPVFGERPPARSDPLLAALPVPKGGSAVVMEVNALRHSPAGELMVECFSQRTRGRGVESMQRRLGINPLQDVDRVAMWDSGAIMTGNLGKFPWDKVATSHSVKGYGEHGKLYRPGQDGLVDLEDGGTQLQGSTLGRWKEEIVFITDTEEEAKTILDRLEGRARAEQSVISEDMAYGELYGTLGAKEVAELLPEDRPELKELFLKGADSVALHLDATGDVGLLAEVQGAGSEELQDVAKSLGAALAVARFKAKADGEEELAELLELARVNPNGKGNFSLELAVPLELMKRKMSFCRPPTDPDGPPATPPPGVVAEPPSP
jgi:hypothetical protein